MVRRIVAVGAICGVLAAGCAGRAVWRHENLDTAQFKRDSYECNRDAALMHPPMMVGGGLAGALQAIGYKKDGEKFFKEYMESKGYYEGKDGAEQHSRADIRD